MWRWMWVITFGMLVIGISPTQAEDSGWTAWLRYGRHMTLVNAAGETLQEVELPLDIRYAHTLLSVSPDGKTAAFQVWEGSTGQAESLLFYDLQQQAVISNYPLPDGTIIQTVLRQNLFSENLAAYGFVTPEHGWRLIVLDIQTGEIAAEIDSLTVQDGIPREQHVPVVRAFSDNKLWFSLLNLGADRCGGMDGVAFMWNITTKEVQPTIAYRSERPTIFQPTGEVVFSLCDPDDPAYGGVYAYDPINQSQSLIYRPAGQYTPYFVQNGERILLRHFEDQMRDWVLLERSGENIGQWQPPSQIVWDAIAGTAEGFLYTTQFVSADHEVLLNVPALLEVNTRDGLDAGRTVWHLSIAEYQERSGGDAPLEIAWVDDPAPLGPFIPWGQLDEPIYAPTITAPAVDIQPTALPTPEPIFHVGMTVTVQTTEGEILNLRAEPTRESEILIYLEDDLTLILLEGPVEAEGFTWWRVRTPDGLEGWAVENNGELQTLVPNDEE
ncbi:MAG: SH3 domain-containing protein [Anaerolineae bacterium]|nr:SH3 domain-containing protein [Anaerolineae bacterium]